MRYHLSAAALAVVGALLSPTTLTDTYPKNPNIDALNYAFTIELSDTTDLIVGELALDVRFVGAGVRAVRLDLISASAAEGGTGMRVSGVTMNGKTNTVATDTTRAFVVNVNVNAGTVTMVNIGGGLTL